MGNLRIAVIAASLLLIAAALAACGGETALDQRAQSLEGGALSSFGGADGTDPDMRDVARDIAIERGYDFTPAGHVVAAGAATSWSQAALSDFGDGAGTITVNGDDATVELEVASFDPLVTDVTLQGTFSVADAQATVDNPGSSFSVDWEISWTASGEARSLSAQQTLLGMDWVQI